MGEEPAPTKHEINAQGSKQFLREGDRRLDERLASGHLCRGWGLPPEAVPSARRPRARPCAGCPPASAAAAALRPGPLGPCRPGRRSAALGQAGPAPRREPFANTPPPAAAGGLAGPAPARCDQLGEGPGQRWPGARAEASTRRPRAPRDPGPRRASSGTGQPGQGLGRRRPRPAGFRRAPSKRGARSTRAPSHHPRTPQAGHTRAGAGDARPAPTLRARPRARAHPAAHLAQAQQQQQRQQRPAQPRRARRRPRLPRRPLHAPRALERARDARVGSRRAPDSGRPRRRLQPPPPPPPPPARPPSPRSARPGLPRGHGSGGGGGGHTAEPGAAAAGGTRPWARRGFVGRSKRRPPPACGVLIPASAAPAASSARHAARAAGSRGERSAPSLPPPPLNIHRFLPPGRPGGCRAPRPLAALPLQPTPPPSRPGGGEGAEARPARALASPLPRAEEAPLPCPPSPPSPPTFLGPGTRDPGPAPRLSRRSSRYPSVQASQPRLRCMAQMMTEIPTEGTARPAFRQRPREGLLDPAGG